VLERVFEAGGARARLTVMPGVVHGRDDDIDVTTWSFELARGRLRIVGSPEGLSIEGSAAVRDRMEQLITQRCRAMLASTLLPATPAEWLEQARSASFTRPTPLVIGKTRVFAASYSTRWFGTLLSPDRLRHAPLGWMPDPSKPVMLDEVTSARGEELLGEVSSLASALGLEGHEVRHRESFTTEPGSPARGFWLDELGWLTPGNVEAAYARAGSWHLRLARLTAPDKARRWSFIAQDERCTAMLRGRASQVLGDTTQLQVTVHTHGDRTAADALLSALGAQRADTL